MFVIITRINMLGERCKKCNAKKSVLLKCKCGNSYCTRDILPEIHQCTQLENIKKDAYNKNKNNILKACEKQKVEWIT